MDKEALIEELMSDREKAGEDAERELAKQRKKVSNLLQSVQKDVVSFKDTNRLFKIPNFDEELASTQDKYSQTMYEKSQDLIGEIAVPENITLKSVEGYIEEIESSFQQVTDKVFSKYISKLDSSFSGKVKGLDRAYRKVFKTLNKLKKYIHKNYSPRAQVEEALWLIDDLIPLLHEYYQTLDMISEQDESYNEFSRKIEVAQKELRELQNHPTRLQYDEVVRQYSEYQRKFDVELSDVRKALKKYINKKSKEKNPGDLSFMKKFVTDAATTLAEQSSTISISSLLSTIKELLQTNQLELKRERKESAIAHIDVLIDGELDAIHKEAKGAYLERATLEKELEDLDLDAQIHKKEQEIDMYVRDRRRVVEPHLRTASKLLENIEKHLASLENKFGITLSHKVPDVPNYEM